MNLNEALRKFDLIEANLAKLDSIWARMTSLIPPNDGIVIVFSGGSQADREYQGLARDFRDLVDALPMIDGWTVTARPLSLDEMAQDRLDELDVGEFRTFTQKSALAPQSQLDEYRHRLTRKRRQLVSGRLEELIAEADTALEAALVASGVLSRDDHGDARSSSLDRFARLVSEADRILGSTPRSAAWQRLQRHLGFARGVDLIDIHEHDWPTAKQELRCVAIDNEPHAVGLLDVADLVAAAPRGQVSTALNWATLSAEDFERLTFAIITSAEGYENPDWLMRTNAPDRARDLSVVRVRHDSLGGVMRDRVIIQCKHWLTRSVSATDIGNALTEVSAWEPPIISTLVFATSGRFTAEAVRWVEKHNFNGKRPAIETWPESHLERLLAQRPHLVVDFGLR